MTLVKDDLIQTLYDAHSGRIRPLIPISFVTVYRRNICWGGLDTHSPEKSLWIMGSLRSLFTGEVWRGFSKKIDRQIAGRSFFPC